MQSSLKRQSKARYVRLVSVTCALGTSVSLLQAVLLPHSLAWAQPAPSSAPAPAPANAANAAGGASAPAPLEGKDREIYIDVGRAGARKLKLAIPTFGASGGQLAGIAPADREGFSSRLGEILSFTGSFEVMPQSGFVAKEDSASRPVNFEEWMPLNTEFLIQGKFETSGSSGRSVLELRLYDVKRQKMLVGKRYSNLEKKDVEPYLRRFADLCMLALTGEMGIFSTKIAFVGAKKAGEPKQVYLANFDGSGLQQITDNGSINLSPSWSPDGSKVTFTSFKDGKAEIYVYNLVTKKLGRLTKGQGSNSGASWHPNGKTIIFSGSAAGNTAIYQMNSIDGGNRTMFISGSGLEVEASFAPDASRVAFASGRFGNPHIFVRDMASNQDTRITFAGWYNSTPSWRPDGKKIAFAAYDKEIDRFDLCIINPDGRQLERLTLDQGDNEKPSWSPDGRFIAYQSNRIASGRGKTKTYKLFVMTRDGADQRPLNVPLYDIGMPAWGPRQGDLD